MIAARDALVADVFDAVLPVLDGLPGAVYDVEDVDALAAYVVDYYGQRFMRGTVADMAGNVVSLWKIEARYVSPFRHGRPVFPGVANQVDAYWDVTERPEWKSDVPTHGLIRTPLPGHPSRRESHPKRTKGAIPTPATASPVVATAADGTMTAHANGRSVEVTRDESVTVLAAVGFLPPWRRKG